MTTPIEQLVDAACGVVPNRSPSWVLLKCPVCGRTQAGGPDKLDPPGTAEVHLTCPQCFRGGTFEDPTYFDLGGLEIRPV